MANRHVRLGLTSSHVDRLAQEDQAALLSDCPTYISSNARSAERWESLPI